MTARSELFVDETVRDCIENNKFLQQLNSKKFFWSVEIPKDWYGIWRENEFPRSGDANIHAEIPHPTPLSRKLKGKVNKWDGRQSKDILVGKVSWATKFTVEGDYERYIDAEPSEIKIKFNKNLRLLLK